MRYSALIGAVLLLVACSQALLAACSQAAAPAPKGPRAGSYSGSIGAATYLVDLPKSWNGTLLLYSHGYAAPGGANPAADGGDTTTKGWLLE